MTNPHDAPKEGKDNSQDQTGRVRPESTQKLQEGKKDLVLNQQSEADRLKAGGRSGITNEFGKPLFYDSAEEKLNKRETLIAQADAGGQKPSATRDIQTDSGVRDQIKAGHSIKFTVKGKLLETEAIGNWDPRQWAEQQRKLGAYFQQHGDEWQALYNSAKQNGSVELKSKTYAGRVSDGETPAKNPAPEAGEDPLDAVRKVLHEGHAIRFASDGNGLQWQGEGKWDNGESGQQDQQLKNLFADHPDMVKRLIAEIQKNGGSLEVKHPTLTGKVSDDTTPDALTPPTIHTDQHQHLAGNGFVDGRPISIGENAEDKKIPANAPDNTPVTVRTADGSEIVKGRVVTMDKKRYFQPDEAEDLYGNRHEIAHTRQNLVPLRSEGVATYD